MSAIDLKARIHKIVDEIESEQLLQTLYDFLKIREASRPGQLWSELSEEQKQEVLLAYEESKDVNNLIDIKSIFKERK